MRFNIQNRSKYKGSLTKSYISFAHMIPFQCFDMTFSSSAVVVVVQTRFLNVLNTLLKRKHVVITYLKRFANQYAYKTSSSPKPIVYWEI